jgi:hypothetical protein
MTGCCDQEYHIMEVPYTIDSANRHPEYQSVTKDDQSVLTSRTELYLFLNFEETVLTELRIECAGAGSVTATLRSGKGEGQFLELYSSNKQD